MSSISDFQEFAEALRERGSVARRVAPELLRAAERELSPGAARNLGRVASMLASALDDVEAAAEKLDEQNAALFAARVEQDEQGRFYRELFDLGPAACLVTTREGRITHANHAATDFFGLPGNALVGRLVGGFVDAREGGAFRAALERAQSTPSVEEFPIRLRCRGGSAKDCRIRVAARRDPGAGDYRVQALQWMITEDGSTDADLL